jgi:hypothetical protein
MREVWATSFRYIAFAMILLAYAWLSSWFVMVGCNVARGLGKLAATWTIIAFLLSVHKVDYTQRGGSVCC